MKQTNYLNIIFTYAGYIMINLVGIIDLDWGTQLYIHMIEGSLIAIIMIWAGTWEVKQCEKEYLADRPPVKKGALKMMSALDDDEMPEF